MRSSFFLGLCFILFFSISNLVFSQSFEQYYSQISENKEKSLYDIDESIIDSAVALCPDIRNYPDLLNEKAIALYMRDQIDMAIKYLELAIEYTPEDSIAALGDYSFNMGSFYLQLKNYNQSNKYYKKALALSEKEKLTLDNDEIKAEILWNNVLLNEPNALQTNIDFIDENFKNDACFYYYYQSNYIEYFLQKNQLDRCKEHLHVIDKNRNQISECNDAIMEDFYLFNAEVFSLENESKKSNLYLDSLINIQPLENIPPIDELDIYKLYKANYKLMGKMDSFNKYEDLYSNAFFDLSRDNKNRALTNNEEGQKLNLLLANQKKQNNHHLARNTIIILTLLLFSVYLIKKYKNRNRQILLSNQKIKDDQNILKKNILKTWNSYTLSNKYLRKFKKNDAQEIGQIAQNLASKNPEFSEMVNPKDDIAYKEIESEFPFLNDTEKLILFYKHLGLSHKEIAQLLNRTVKSIDSIQYRINKKIKTHNQIK